MRTLEEISIGSTGFSQFGTPDYYAKQKFEGKYLMNYFTKNFTIHDNLFYKWKRNQYENDSYWDLNVCYWDNEHVTPEEMELMWEDINKLEQFDIESLQEEIQNKWDEENCKVIPIRKVA